MPLIPQLEETEAGRSLGIEGQVGIVSCWIGRAIYQDPASKQTNKLTNKQINKNKGYQ